MADILSPEIVSQIVAAIQGIRFGFVHVTVHDSRVVQIEKAEKIRCGKDADLTPGGVLEDGSRADRTTGGSRTNGS